MSNNLRVALTLTVILAAGAACAHGDDEGLTGKAPQQLGEVQFPVACNSAAQMEFNRAMALFHSFWFEPAKKSFAKVLELDPECGMADWGIAIMSMGNPFAWPANPVAMKAAATAAGEAQRVGAKTERERDYITALSVFFKDWETTEYRARAVAFEKAMGDVAARYPQDDEAQILYALMLDATALPTDKTYANQLKAAGILEPLFKKYPNHPGVAHYLIHTYDYAALAEKGLPAARAYAGIAPSVPHALHMPSHIFSRLGLWPEMVEGNRVSSQAAKDELSDKTLGIGTYDALHAMDYMVFGELQQAQDMAAKQVVDEVGAMRKINVENFVAAYAFAAIPARYALERGDWKAAAALKVEPERSGLEQVSSGGSDPRLLPWPGCGAYGRYCGGAPGRGAAAGAEGGDGGSQDRLLAGPDRLPDQGGECLDRTRGETQRRGSATDARCCGCGGGERQASGNTGQCRAVAGTAGRDAARARPAGAGVDRVRALAPARSESLSHRLWRGTRRGSRGQPRGSQSDFTPGCRL